MQKNRNQEGAAGQRRNFKVGRMESKQRQPLLEEAKPEAGKRRKTARLGLLGLGSVAALMAIFALGYLPRLERQKQLYAAVETSNIAHPAVTVTAVRRSEASTDLLLPGNIQAIDETTIYARADGYLRRRLVDIGDRVEERQLLAEIETPELDQQIRQARASLEQARASLEQARAALKQSEAGAVQAQANLELADVTARRWKSLVQEGVLSQQDGDEKRSAFEARKADLEAAQAGVNAARANVNAAQANVQASEANLQRLAELQSFQKVVAPFDGVITARNIDVGSLITAGSGSSTKPLFSIAQIGRLRIYVNLPQTFVPSIQPGQPAEVIVQEFPGRAFPGKVTRTANSLDEKSHTLLTEVQVANPDHKLLPGMYAQVKFVLDRPSPPVLAPAEALVVRSDGNYVAVVRPDRTLHFQRVEIGRDYGTQIEITSGLAEGASVVVNPTDDLQEGSQVEPVARPKPGK
jgi:RND family efflux transporter MFP subunit